jgi:DNA replication protein DnaC
MNTLTTGEIWDSYNIPKRLVTARFENYIPQNQNQIKAVDILKKWSVDGMDKIKQGQGLFIHGPVGTGKSHLSVATMYEVLNGNTESFKRIPGPLDYDPYGPGVQFAFVNVVDLLTTIKDGFDGSEYKKEKAYYMMRQVRGYEVIVLDDIGAEKQSEWVEEQLFGIIDLRYRMQRATIFTTNCTINQLEKQIGSRSVSRIIDMTDGVKVDGPDYRKRKLI